MDKILLGKGKAPFYLNLKMLNRHGIIAGATGTGKTVSLKVIAEQLSSNGISVFLSDVKGDLGSILKPIEMNENIAKRIEKIGISNFEPTGFPVEFYDVFAEEGTTIRCTISEMGPLMLSKFFGLNDIQSGVLTISFQIADENGWELDDLKDLRALLTFVQENSSEFSKTYGTISSASIGAILRSLLVIEQQGGNFFFGKPSFDVMDFIKTDANRRGIINILNSKKLMRAPQLYATFLFWLLSELFENLDEVGDLDKPKMVFFFDEAHVLFNSDNKILLEKIELLVRLIRSKGVGIFFITQNPTDIPDTISSQLGTRIQHGLRAFSPKELKDVKAIANTLRSDTSFDVEEAIMNLGVGEAVCSTLDEKGIPTFADKILVAPPLSSLGLVEPIEIAYVVNHSVLYNKYITAEDTFSAYEALLKKREHEKTQINEKKAKAEEKNNGGLFRMLSGLFEGNKTRKSDSAMDRLTKNMMSSVGREIGNHIVRGIFGTKK